MGELRKGEGNQWQSAFTGIHPDTKRPYICLVEEPVPDIGPWSEPFLPPELMLVREKDWREAYGSASTNGRGAAAAGRVGGGGAKTIQRRESLRIAISGTLTWSSFWERWVSR